MRVTFATFAIGMMALSGVPFLFSGFWSKEAILHAASEWEVSRLPLLAGLGAVVLTAFYMTRLLCEVFLGRPRSEAAAHAHESPLVMTIPLCLLAAGAIGLGFLGTPAWPWLQSALSGSPVGAAFDPGQRRPARAFDPAGRPRPGLGLGALRAPAARRSRSSRSAGARLPAAFRLPGLPPEDR